MPNIWIILIITFSSFIKGITGFGFALFSFPLLLHWYTPKEIIPVLTICNLISSIMIVLQKKEHKLLDKQSYLLIGAGGIFTVFGVIALSTSDGRVLFHLAGTLFILKTILSLKKRKHKETKLPNYAYILAGSFIGFITGAISVSGPPLAIFLKRVNVDNLKFREIFAAFSVITAIIAILGYFHTGMLSPKTITDSVIFVPILLAGTIIGKKLNGVLSIRSFQTINVILTLISGVLLVIN